MHTAPSSLPAADAAAVPTVFVQEVALVDCPFDDVARRLEADPTGMLAGPSDGTVPAAAGDGIHWRVGPERWPDALARSVVVHLGPVRRRDAVLLVALSWEPDAASALLPRLDADLELAPCGTSETALTLRGRYDPPAGAIGRRIDGLVLHRLAEATVRACLAYVRDRLDPAVVRPPEQRPVR